MKLYTFFKEKALYKFKGNSFVYYNIFPNDDYDQIPIGCVYKQETFLVIRHSWNNWILILKEDIIGWIKIQEGDFNSFERIL